MSLCVAAALLLGGALAAGCGDDEAAQAVSGPKSPPAVRIVSVTGGAASEWTPDAPAPIFPSCDPTRSVGVLIDVSDELGSTFTLRPPGACGGAPQCGYVAVTVSGNSSFPWTAASPFVTVGLQDLGFRPGEHRFRVELRNDRGEAVANAGAVVFDEAVVDVQEPSGCELEAGIDTGSEGSQTDTSSDVSQEPDGADAGDAGPDAALDGSEAGDAPDGPEPGDAAGDAPDAG